MNNSTTSCKITRYIAGHMRQSAQSARRKADSLLGCTWASYTQRSRCEAWGRPGTGTPQPNCRESNTAISRCARETEQSRWIGTVLAKLLGNLGCMRAPTQTAAGPLRTRQAQTMQPAKQRREKEGAWEPVGANERRFLCRGR